MTNGGQPPEQYPPAQYPQQPGQYPQPPGQYQQPGQYPPGQYPQVPRNNGMAVAALVLGIVGLFCWIGSVPALIMGIVSRRQIRESNGMQTGDGMAVTGIVLGAIGVAILVVYLVLLAVGAATFTFDVNS